MKEIYPGFYYEGAKFIRVTYLVTLPNARQCERISESNDINEVLKKTYVYDA
jgi:hypothetical protein